MSIMITSHATGERITIARDVCAMHPKWVHAQLGTADEGELQACLDGLNVTMWYRDGKHLGPDITGLEMFEESLEVYPEPLAALPKRKIGRWDV